MREVESSINAPVLPRHSCKLGITSGAALGLALAESTRCKGMTFVKINSIPSNIVIQNAAIFFLTSGTPTKGLFGNRYENALFMSICSIEETVNLFGYR